VGILEEVSWQVGFLKAMRVDQGAQFVSRDLDQWACQRGVALDFSWPGKPTDHALIANGGVPSGMFERASVHEPRRYPPKNAGPYLHHQAA
jgi:transposase InsO family protein